jgi:hypothetical protein
MRIPHCGSVEFLNVRRFHGRAVRAVPGSCIGEPFVAIHKTSMGKAIAYGIASVAMFFALFKYSDHFVDWASRTRDGEKVLFIIPILVAFAFSYVHGAFTGFFWDTLGLKAAKAAEVKKK